MLIYCDSSALVKLVAEESESRALEEWLSAQPEPVLTSSVLARTEVLRAVRRLGPEAVDAARELLADLAMVALDGDLADHAGGLDPAGMPPRPRRQPCSPDDHLWVRNTVLALCPAHEPAASAASRRAETRCPPARARARADEARAVTSSPRATASSTRACRAS